MRAIKFSKCGLMRVHVSSIVNEVIRTIRFLWKYFELSAQKRKSSKNLLIKQKQANKKQQRQRFLPTKTSEREPLKKTWDCRDNLIYYTTPTNDVPPTTCQPNNGPPTNLPSIKCTNHRPTDHWPVRNLRSEKIWICIFHKLWFLNIKHRVSAIMFCIKHIH